MVGCGADPGAEPDPPLSSWAWRVAIVSGVLLAFGNAAEAVAGPNALATSWATVAQAAGTMLIVAAAARWCRVTWAEMGVHRANLIRSALVGAATALLIVVLALAVLHLGTAVGAGVTYGPIRGETLPALLFHALLALPMLTALPEELAFRGLLLGLLKRRLSSWRASLLMSAAFVAWHGVAEVQTLAQTNFTPGLVVPAAIVSVLALFAGGLLFAFLRLRTGNLAAAFIAHWWFDAGLVLGLYALARM
jgi:uncharacterized protein